MSSYVTGRELGVVSDVDLSADPDNLYRIVSLAASTANSTGRKIVLSSSNTDANILGVLNSVPKAGETAAVVLRNAQGTFKIRLGANTGAVSVNDLLTADTDGGGLKTTSSGDIIVGRALEAGVAGQVIEFEPINHKQQS